MPKVNSQTNYYDKKDVGHTSTYESVKRSYDRLSDKEKQLVNYDIQSNPDKYISATSMDYRDDPLYNSSLQAKGLDASIPDDWEKQIPKKNGVYNAIDSDGSINQVWQRAYDNMGILRPFLSINSSGTPQEEKNADANSLQNLAYRQYKKLQAQYEDEAEVESWRNRVYQKDGVVDEAATRAFQDLTTEEKRIVNSFGVDGKPSAVSTREDMEVYQKFQDLQEKYRIGGASTAYSNQVFANPDGSTDEGKTRAFQELSPSEQAVIVKLGKNGYPSGLTDVGDLAIFNKFDAATERYNKELAGDYLTQMQSGTKYANSSTVGGGSSAVNLRTLSSDQKKDIAKRYNLAEADIDELIDDITSGSMPAYRRERARASLGANNDPATWSKATRLPSVEDVAENISVTSPTPATRRTSEAVILNDSNGSRTSGGLVGGLGGAREVIDRVRKGELIGDAQAQQDGLTAARAIESLGYGAENTASGLVGGIVRAYNAAAALMYNQLANWTSTKVTPVSAVSDPAFVTALKAGATKLLGGNENPVSQFFRNARNEMMGEDIVDKWNDSINSRYTNISDAQKTVAGYQQEIARMLPRMALASATAGASESIGISEFAAEMIPKYYTLFSAAGAAIKDKTSEDMDKTFTYGIYSGAVEGLIEELLGGIPIAGAGALDDVVKGVIGRVSSNPFIQSMLFSGASVLGESIEESISAFVDPFLRRATIDQNAPLASAKAILQQGLEGGAVAFAFQLMFGVATGASNLLYGSDVKNAAINSVDQIISSTNSTTFDPDQFWSAEKIEGLHDFVADPQTVLNDTQVHVKPERYDALVNSHNELEKAQAVYDNISTEWTQALQSGQRLSVNEIRSYQANVKAAADKLAQTRQAMTAAEVNFNNALNEAQQTVNEAQERLMAQAQAEREAANNELYEIYRSTLLDAQTSTALANAEDPDVAITGADIDSLILSRIAPDAGEAMREAYDQLEPMRQQEQRLMRQEAYYRSILPAGHQTIQRISSQLQELRDDMSYANYQLDQARDAFVQAAHAQVLQQGAETLGTQNLESARRLAQARQNVNEGRTVAQLGENTVEQDEQAQGEYERFTADRSRSIHWSRQRAIDRISDPSQPITGTDVDLTLKSGVAPRQARALAEAYNAAVQASDESRQTERLQGSTTYESTRPRASQVTDNATIETASVLRERLAQARADFAAAAQTRSGTATESTSALRTAYLNVEDARAALRGAQARLDEAYESQNDLQIDGSETAFRNAQQSLDDALQKYNELRDPYIGGMSADILAGSQAVELSDDGSVRSTRQQHASTLQAPARATQQQLNAAVNAAMTDPEATISDPVVHREVMETINEASHRETQDNWANARPDEEISGTYVDKAGVRRSVATDSYLRYDVALPDDSRSGRALRNRDEVSREFAAAFESFLSVGNDADIQESGATELAYDRSGLIKIKDYGDYQSVIHGVGHRAAELFGISDVNGVDRVWQQFPEAIQNQYNNDQEVLRGEAYAEAFKMYVYNPDYARQFWPEYVETLEQSMNRHQRQAIREMSRAVRADNAASFGEKVDNTQTDKRKSENLLRRLSKSLFTRGGHNRFISRVFDPEIGLDEVEQAARRNLARIGETRAASDNLYQRGNYNLGSNARANSVLYGIGIVNWDTEDSRPVRAGKSLAEVIAPIKSEADRNLFYRYLKLTSAIDDERMGYAVFPKDMTLDAQEQELADIVKDHPNFVKVGNDFFNWHHTYMHVRGVETGLMSEASFNEMIEKRPHYLPFNRDIPQNPSGSTDINKDIGPITGVRFGSRANTFNPIQQVAAQIYAIERLNDNVALRRLLYKTITEVPGMAIYASEENGSKTLEHTTNDPSGDPDTWWYSQPALFTNNDELGVRLSSGQMKYLKINDPVLLSYFQDATRVAASMQELDNMWKQAGEVVQSVNRVAAGLLTVHKPTFAITNAERDIPTAWAKSKQPIWEFPKFVVRELGSIAENTAKYTFDLFGDKASSKVGSIATKVLGEEKGRSFNKFMGLEETPIGSPLNNMELYMASGMGNTELRGNINEPKNVRAIMQRIQPTIKDKIVAKGMDVWDALPTIGERSPRYAEFLYSMKQSGGDYVYATNEANRITTDFRKGGRAVRAAKKFWLFAGANMNGLYQDWRILSGREYRKTDGSRDKAAQWNYVAKATSYNFLMSLASILSWKAVRKKYGNDDEEFLPDYVDDNSFTFAYGNGGDYLKWRVPQSVSFAMNREVWELAYRASQDPNFDAPVAIRDMIADVAGAASPVGDIGRPGEANPLGSSFLGATEVNTFYLNRKWTNSEIDYAWETTGDSATSPELHVGKYTTKLAKALGELTGLSPKQWDVELEQRGSYLYDLYGMFTDKTGLSEGFKNYIGDVFVGNALYTTDIFNNVYNERDKVQVIINDIEATGSSPKYKRRLSEEEILNANDEAEGLYQILDNAAGEMSDIRNEIAQLQADGAPQDRIIARQREMAVIAAEALYQTSLYKSAYLRLRER